MPSKPAAYWQQGVLAVLLAAAVVAFNAWTVLSVTPDEVRLFGADQGDYSNLMMRSLREGHLYVDVTPSPALIHAENPYDPAKRPPGVALSDASYYKGRYYMYFGVAPVVTLFLPWRLVTGHDLPAPFAALILVNGAFLASAGLWWMLRRRYFPDSGVLALILGILVIGLGSMTYSVLRRTSIWEPPVAAGYLFATLALVCLYRGLHGVRRLRWFTAAGVSLGLAVGSRPTYLVGVAAFAIPLAVEWLRGRSEGRFRLWPDRVWWGQAIALGLPFGLIFAALLGYNYARFENPFEFGMRYQLTGTYEAAVRHFSAAYLRFNAYVYYLVPAQWGRYFPFVEPIHMPPAPPGYYTCEYVYGVLANFPFAWVAVLAPLALLRRGRDEMRALGTFLGSTAALFASLSVFLLFFVTSTARYMLDFVPALMFLACVGLLAAERAATGARSRRFVLGAGAVAAALSVFVCTMLNFQLQDLLRQLNPPLFRTLAHAFDEPVWQIERRTGTRFGPLEITVRFPEGRAGRVEPLVATGWEFWSDYLFVNYLDKHSLRIGFAHAGFPTRWSEPLTLDYAAEHRLRVGMGSLFPPRAHPFFDEWDDLEYGSLCRWLQVALDDKAVLDAPQDFYDASPGSLRIGWEPTNTYGGRFSGRIARVARGSFAAAIEPVGQCGPVLMKLSIPANASKRQVPLLTTGMPGQGDALVMRATGPGTVRFYYDHWGEDLLESGDVPIGGEGGHELLVSIPSLWPEKGGPESPLRHSLFLSLDGRTLAFQEVPGYSAKHGAVHFGTNGIGSTLFEPEYPWAIREVRPVPPETLLLLAHEGVAKWMRPADQRSVQREAEDFSDNSRPLPWRSAAARAVLLSLAAAWAVLAVWVVGRLLGLGWAALFARALYATMRPFRGPAAWIWRRRVPVALTVLAATAGGVAWRQRAAYLRAVGPMHLRLRLPIGYWTRQQPILSTGKPGAGTTVFLTYSDRLHVRAGADVWGALYLSAPVAVDYSKPVDVVVNSSALYPLDHPRVKDLDSGLRERLRNEFFVAIGGQTVLSEPRSAYESRVSEIAVGENRIGSSFAQPRFEGRILAVERLPELSEFRVREGGGIRVEFRMGEAAGTEVQPLLALGENGSLGLCYARPLPASSFRVGYRSPGGVETDSSVFPDEPGSVHELEIVPGYIDARAPVAAARMTLDGVGISPRRGFAPYSECRAVSGFNPFASPGIGQFFGGGELRATIHSLGEPAQSAAASGPLVMIVRFPDDQTGSDPLVASGVIGAADFLYAEYRGGNRLRFGIDHWGAGGKIGSEVAFDPHALHRLEIETGALVPSSEGSATAGILRVRLDGAVALEAESRLHPRRADQIFIGRNPIGGSTAGPRFRGEILVSERRPGPGT